MRLTSQLESRKREWSSNVLACDNIGRSLGGNSTLWGIYHKRRLDQTLFVGKLWDDLTGVLHVLELQLLPPLPSSLSAINPAKRALAGKWAFKRRKSEK